MSQMSQMSQMSLSLSLSLSISLSLSLSGLKGSSLYVKSKSTVTKSSHMSRMSQMSEMSQACLLIALIKCLKGHKSLGNIFVLSCLLIRWKWMQWWWKDRFYPFEILYIQKSSENGENNIIHDNHNISPSKIVIMTLLNLIGVGGWSNCLCEKC